MSKRLIAIAGVFTLLLTSSAWAAQITTPSLPTNGASSVSCRVLNAGTTLAKDVTITLYDGSGAFELGTLPVDLAAGHTDVLVDSSPSPIVYCRVSGIAKSNARVTLCLLDGSSVCPTAVTVP